MKIYYILDISRTERINWKKRNDKTQREFYTTNSCTKLYRNIYTCPMQRNHTPYMLQQVVWKDDEKRVLLGIIPTGIGVPDILLCFWGNRIQYSIFKTDLFALLRVRTYSSQTRNGELWVFPNMMIACQRQFLYLVKIYTQRKTASWACKLYHVEDDCSGQNE